jgi:hypothetical protein
MCVDGAGRHSQAPLSALFSARRRQPWLELAALLGLPFAPGDDFAAAAELLPESIA